MTFNATQFIDNPARFAYAFFRDRQGKPFTCYPYQEEILRHIFLKTNRFFQLQQCTQTGKTEIIAVAAAMSALCRSRERINIISYTLQQSQEMFSRCKAHLLYDHPIISARVRREPLTQTEIHVSHSQSDRSRDSIIRCFTASQASQGENLLGFSGTIVIIDESGSIPNNIYLEKILRMGVAKSSQSTLIESGTPHRRNHFYDSSIDHRYTHFKVSVYDGLRAGALDSQMIEFVKTQLPARQWTSWYEAEFPSDQEAFFPTSLIEPNIQSEERNPSALIDYTAGLDFAKEVDKSVFTIAELHANTLWERKILSYRHVNYVEQMSALSNHFADFRPKIVFGDNGGPGAPLLDQIERTMKVRKVVRVAFSTEKTAMYINLQNLLKEGRYKLLDNLEAITELGNLEHSWVGPRSERLVINAPTHIVNGQLLGDDHPDSKALTALALSPSRVKKSNWFEPIVR